MDFLPPVVRLARAHPDAADYAIGYDAEGLRYLLAMDSQVVQASLAQGMVLEPYEAPTEVTRVASVLPVAFRRAARATPNPAGEGSVMDALLAAAAGDPDKADAVEYAVRIERADLIEGGMPAELADKVLALAASYPGAGAVPEPIMAEEAT
jgi:hypothetical protein